MEKKFNGLLKGKEYNKIKKIVIKIFNIWFADGKDTLSRVMAIFSALFWTWLEVSFLYFFFSFAFGFSAYIPGNNNYQTALDFFKAYPNLINSLVIIIVITIFVMRVPIYYKKEIKKDGRSPK